jgi:hypothetical protein
VAAMLRLNEGNKEGIDWERVAQNVDTCLNLLHPCFFFFYFEEEEEQKSRNVLTIGGLD